MSANEPPFNSDEFGNVWDWSTTPPTFVRTATRTSNEPPFESPADIVCPMCNAQPGRPCWDMRTAVPKTIDRYHREREVTARG